MDEIERLGVQRGDTVIVGRAGDVIPDVIKVLPELRPDDAKAFRMPTTCPVCDKPVEKDPDKVAYRCVNRDCPARRRQDIYHFISRGALDIDGIGPKIIDQLMDAGLVQDAASLFTLKTDDLMNLEGFAEVSSQNVVNAIHERMTIALHRFIYGLGIPNVGEETARTLAEHFHTFDMLKGATPEDLKHLPDVGPIVARSIEEWFDKPYHKELLKKFDQVGLEITAERVHRGKLSGKTVVVTGTLQDMGRDEAKEAIRRAGGKSSGSVSKETDLVVVGENPGGAKFDAAKKQGITMIDEDAFLRLVK
jgi:DNA ligase (NAD+)